MRHKCPFLLMLTLFSIAAVIRAQDETPVPDCRQIVTEAVENASRQCFRMGIDQVCYGNAIVSISPASDEFDFPGAAVDLSTVESIMTSSMDFDSATDTSQWGLAIVRMRANLPADTYLTYLLAGDVTITNAPELAEVPSSTLDKPASFQSFYVLTGTSAPVCDNAPHGLIIQNQHDTVATLNLNGVEISLASSTIAVTATETQGMQVVVVAGQIQTHALGERNAFSAGQNMLVQLGGNPGELTAVTRPVASRGYNLNNLRHLPLNMLPQYIRVETTAPWTDTGIQLTARQPFYISAAGSSNMCGGDNNSGCADNATTNTWVGPDGNLPLGVCTGRDGDCPLMPGRYAALIGRVGDGEPFLIGAGGGFIANADGTLQLGYNDNTYEDNAGTYYAFVTIDGVSVRAITQQPEVVVAPCSLTVIQTANLRTGPATTYDLVRTLNIGTDADAVGQAPGADGFTWWRLDDESWVREDLVREEGECSSLPVVAAP